MSDRTDTGVAASHPVYRSQTIILIADPAPDYLDTMRPALDSRYELAVAPDAAQALAIARQRSPALILYDVGLGGERGTDLIRAVRADRALRDLPIVLMAPRATDGAPFDPLGDESADDLLDRPFSLRDLIARIEVNLRRSRRQARAARRDAELQAQAEAIIRRINIVLAHLPFGVTMVNPEGVIVYSNPARDGLLRFDDRERRPGDRLAEWLPAYTAEGRKLSTEEYPIRRALKGELVTGLELRYEPSDGAERWISASGIPIHGPDGKLQYAIGVTIDISGEMQARRELIGLTATLEERVRAEIEERTKAEDALRQAQKLQSIGQLTGGIAHDFNNLLQVMLGNLDALERHVASDRPLDRARLNRQIAASLRGADRAARLTQQLLAFARRQPLEPTPIDVNQLVRGMTELLRRTLGESVTVETAMGNGLDFAFADRNQLENALLNLAVNARDAMPDGGRLTITTANFAPSTPFIGRWDELPAGDYVMIAVGDTGVGIPSDILPHIFEPFFTTKDVGQGTGLGLSQVYGFTKQSGGHIEIDSDVGAGTTIKLFLPAQQTASDDDKVDAPNPSHRATAGDIVLVVEDDADVRDHSCEILRELGYETVEAADAGTALRRLEADDRIRVMFTDVGLPGMNGRQLADAARERRPDLKILFTTGYARDIIVHHGRVDPDVELIAKPFTAAALAAKLSELLREE